VLEVGKSQTLYRQLLTGQAGSENCPSVGLRGLQELIYFVSVNYPQFMSCRDHASKFNLAKPQPPKGPIATEIALDLSVAEPRQQAIAAPTSPRKLRSISVSSGRLSVVVNETMEPLSQFEVPTHLFRSKSQMIEGVSVIAVKGTLWVERPFYERIHFHLFFLADVLDTFGNRFPERDKGIAVCNQCLD
jgi:hypothetical protein